MADAVGLWVIVYFCVTSVNTKDMLNSSGNRGHPCLTPEFLLHYPVI